MNLSRLATWTEPARVRAVVTSVIALCAALGVVLPFDLPGIAEALILVFAAVLPLAQGESTRAAVISPATDAARIETAQQLAAGELPVTKHHVTPQTPDVADHVAPE